MNHYFNHNYVVISVSRSEESGKLTETQYLSDHNVCVPQNHAIHGFNLYIFLCIKQFNRSLGTIHPPLYSPLLLEQINSYIAARESPMNHS